MVEIVVRVPEDTPSWRTVFLAGDGPVLGDWAADAVALERQAGGTHVVHLDIQGHPRFLATLGRWREAEGDGGGREAVAHIAHRASGLRRLEIQVRGWGRDAVRYHHEFVSKFLHRARTISVWLPPGYDLDPERRFPVLYMQDGQNLFDPETAFAGNPWYADEVAEREVRAERVAPIIIVGIANSVDRLHEYGPRRPGKDPAADRSQEYGRFVVEEVKPFIDETYRTLPGPEHTGVGGSSMGGLIALHLCQRYPDVFRRCAAISPSLWWDREFFLQHVHASPRWMEHCKVWLDMGGREGATETGMQGMVGRTERLAQQLIRYGMKEGEQLAWEIVEGGTHNEAAWRARFDRVLRFLYRA